jgi:Cdc6-like AAA superfamily ATPase
MTVQGNLPRCIYIAGCDGTGKTTQSDMLIRYLRAEGEKVVHRWLRNPFFLSLPFLVYARIRKYSWYETVDGNRYGYWDFRRSRILRTVFPWFLLVDGFLAAVWAGRSSVNDSRWISSQI